MAADILTCQSLGKKVLLSIGGVFNATSGSDYTVSTVTKGNEFANFLWGAFGPLKSTWTGPRPFDFGGETVKFDGFDFDIEKNFSDQSGYVQVINRLRDLFALETTGKYLITGAPQCPQNDPYFDMKTMINQAVFDFLFIQFYNNPDCQASNAAGFNYNAWESYIKNTASKNAKLFIGLPGSPDSGNGYLEPAAAAALLNSYKTKASFGGLMLWDVDTASNKT
ncbi:glycoside hydrolase superfamily, partial [Bombardia bombarda]